MLVHAIAWVLDVIPLLTWVLIAAELLIFAPMSFIGRLRGAAEFGFGMTAALLSFMLWISSAFAVYTSHGLAVLILSILFIGVPTVLIAGVESAINNDWDSLIGMAVMLTAIASAAYGFVKCGTRPNGYLPTILIDPPGPFATKQELRAFLQETNDLTSYLEIREARAQARKDLRRLWLRAVTAGMFG
jgi:hypothetical protein